MIRAEALANGLVVLDAERRTYMALSRDETYWHLIRPLRADDPAVTAENATARAGDLTCCCPGGAFRGNCYRLEQARAYELAQADGDWFGEAAPAAELAAVPA